MGKALIISGAIFLAIVAGVIYTLRPGSNLTPQTRVVVKEKPFAKYSYSALRKAVFNGSNIVIDEAVKEEKQYTSYLFSFIVQGKKVSGLMNLPQKPGSCPVILMIRGYVPKEMYETGVGTSHGGEVLAQNGFITLAPDFFGYGSSANPPVSSLEDRFLTYMTVLELLQSIGQLNDALAKEDIPARYDTVHLGIWGHSNGGQIALSALAISGAKYPTVLWAPVTKPFPYSILYYTDDIEDHGKALRKVIADFEKDYDAEYYSLTNYLDWIQAPIQVHQGSADEAVPEQWSDVFVDTMRNEDKSVEYYTYPGDDHNFTQGSWNTVMQRTMEFYRKRFEE